MHGLAGFTPRRFARLLELCPRALPRLAAPLMGPKTVLLLLKGQDFVHEEQEASKYWGYDLVITDSVTDPGGRIIAVRNLKEKS